MVSNFRYSKRNFYFVLVLFVISTNVFFFQNCSQPFETIRNEEGFETSSWLNLIPPRVGENYVFGDMLVNSSDLDTLNAKRTSEQPRLNSVSTHATGEEMWPGKIIPIRVSTDDPSFFSSTDLDNFKKSVFAACDLWAQEAQINCLQHTNEEYILEAVLTRNVTRYCGPGAGACASYPSANPIRGLWAHITSPELSSLMVHELGHSLGLIHEHQSDNVDKYYSFPSVNSGNDPFVYFQVLPLKYTNFRQYFVNSEYDPQSIMHYTNITNYGVTVKPGFSYMDKLSTSGAQSPFLYKDGLGILTVNDVLGVQKLYGVRSGSKPTCNDPETGKPHFFENTMQGYFQSKTLSEPGAYCLQQNRVCRNGVLSGSYKERECRELCITGDGKTLAVPEKAKVFIKQTDATKSNYGLYEEAQVECRVPGQVAVIDAQGAFLKTALSKDIYTVKPVEMPVTKYTWQVVDSGKCSANPSYSYGTWSECSNNSMQTRSFQCINTSGTQTQTVACKDSSGKTVDNSLCPAQSKPSSIVSCTASCTGSPLISQSCTYTPPVTYTWNTSSYGACSASPTYSYGSWSSCDASLIQTRSAQCVNMTGLQYRTVTCVNSLGKVANDSNCSMQPKPTTSMACTSTCSGSPITTQACQIIEKCPIGSCKPVGNLIKDSIMSNQINVRVQSGELRSIIGYNRSDINIIISKGGLITSYEKPNNKRIYFEGPAGDYTIGKTEDRFIVKDACGYRSIVTVGQDSSIQFIFADGTLEFKLVDGNNAFRQVYQGQLKTTYVLDNDEYYDFSKQLLDKSKTSSSFYSGACRM